MSYPQVSVNTDADGFCFGCGINNPIGLKLNFQRDGDIVKTEFTVGKQYQGWPGIIHGGIIACILDEAVGHLAHFSGRKCVTAKMEVRFRQPAPVEEPLVITSSLVRNTRRLIEAVASITLRDGTLLAECSAVQFVLNTDESSKGTLSNA